MTKSVWLVVSSGLILIGVALFALQPGQPEPVCATDPNATSGFTDPGQDCPISIDSMNAIRDYQSAPRWYRVSGVAVALAGVVVGTVVGILRMRSPRRDQQP